MPRPIWKGHITFGLVNIPVTLFSAENRSDLRFTLVDKGNKEYQVNGGQKVTKMGLAKR